eukprot:s4659_g2.t1
MGLMKDAEPLFRRALEAQERTLGPEHPNTLVSVNNLASCLQAMGLMKDAEPLFRRALEALERTLGAEHPYTLGSVNNLASCLQAMGRMKDAEPLMRRALEALERTLGAEHPHTVVFARNLARCSKPEASCCRQRDAEQMLSSAVGGAPVFKRFQKFREGMGPGAHFEHRLGRLRAQLRRARRRLGGGRCCGAVDVGTVEDWFPFWGEKIPFGKLT